MALKVVIDAEHKVDMEALHKTVSNKGYLPAALEFFHKTGLRDRQVVVTLEQQKEKPILRFQWTMDEEKLVQRINGSLRRMEIDDKLDQEYQRFLELNGEEQEQEQGESYGIWGQKTHQRFNHHQQLERFNPIKSHEQHGVRRYFVNQHNDKTYRQEQEREEQVEYDDDFHMTPQEKEQQRRRFQNRRQEQEKDQDEYSMEDVFSQVDALITGRKSRANHMDRWIHQTQKAMEWAQHQEQQEKEGQFYKSQQKDQVKEECHFMRTEYITKGDRVCFTTRPVLSCGAQCQPQQQKTMEFSFHCLPKSSAFTQQLVKEAEESVLKNIQNKRVDFRQTLSVPVSCSA